jgi:hypothetical protein
MITLNTERGLIKVDNWEDITSTPGHNPNLNPLEHELKEIIGRYVLSYKVNCGLSNCHTPHERGYIVTTKSGSVTNIGKDCGKKYFKVEFEDLHKKFDRYIAENEMRERLHTFLSGIDSIEDRTHNLLHAKNGAIWVNKLVSNLQTRGGNVPDAVIRRLNEMVRSSSGVITKARHATATEIEALKATGARISNPHIIEKSVGEILGFEALSPEYDLRKLLILDIVERLSEFKKQTIDAMTYAQLTYWSKWIGSIETTLISANEAIRHGQRLLKQSNLAQFNQLLGRDEIESFQKFLKQLI